ncbi:MAG: radical SAM protein [Anaerolineaceae bacterium]|jgi:MoaA/NifB/PqqE/SkfB family radical SAM enzyme|nr:radical SAM protein [Anaerolineaceae bacterium]
MVTNQHKNVTLKNTAFNVGLDIAVGISPLLSRSALLRHGVLQTGKLVSSQIRPAVPLFSSLPPGVVTDRAQFGDAFIKTFDRVVARRVSKATLQSIAHNLIHGALVQRGEQSAINHFSEEFGMKPPSFLTISPGKICNLQCKGCYASAGPTAEKLDWSTFDRIITEAKTLWGVRFIVISGGEPLAYRSEGKGLLDAAEKHPDVFFMFYTNGTLIDEETAQRMAALGNVTPAISVEGWRERTDERRGVGVFDKILAAMEQLRKAGVFFGISLTATKHNAEEILSEEFIDYFFEQQGAFYGWIFQYMPIGRSYTLDLMPTPEQRLWMWKRSWEIVKKRKIFLADFWNHGTLSNGCIAGGRARGGGYLYIDWDGHVSPCVFVPYSPVNVKDIYAKGGTLNDVWANPFFADIRGWQESYMQSKGNWLAPCLNRDHHAVLNQLIAKHEPEPIDESARAALLDPDYGKGLERYGELYENLSGSIWHEQYLQDQP